MSKSSKRRNRKTRAQYKAIAATEVSAVIASGNAFWIYRIAIKYCKSHKHHVPKLEDAIIDTENLYQIDNFSKHVKRANRVRLDTFVALHGGVHPPRDNEAVGIAASSSV